MNKLPKTYDIISLNNHLYMVDKEAVIKANEIGTDGYHIEFFRERWQEKDWFKIIASDNSKLGLPLLPKIEEYDEDFKVKCIDLLLHESKDTDPASFIKGYKAASAKKYTEEDMRDIYFNGLIDGIKGVPEDEKGNKMFKEHLRFFKKIPVQVEVEMEAKRDPNETEKVKILHLHFEPKVDSNNFVIVKRWVYE